MQRNIFSRYLIFTAIFSILILAQSCSSQFKTFKSEDFGAILINESISHVHINMFLKRMNKIKKSNLNKEISDETFYSELERLDDLVSYWFILTNEMTQIRPFLHDIVAQTQEDTLHVMVWAGGKLWQMKTERIIYWRTPDTDSVSAVNLIDINKLIQEGQYSYKRATEKKYFHRMNSSSRYYADENGVYTYADSFRDWADNLQIDPGGLYSFSEQNYGIYLRIYVPKKRRELVVLESVVHTML